MNSSAKVAETTSGEKDKHVSNFGIHVLMNKNSRRYLGTVGTTSGLFGIQKAMKTLSVKADDIVEYFELSTEIEKQIEQADSSAYMAIFTTTSTSGVPPEKYSKKLGLKLSVVRNPWTNLPK